MLLLDFLTWLFFHLQNPFYHISWGKLLNTLSINIVFNIFLFRLAGFSLITVAANYYVRDELVSASLEHLQTS